NRRILAAHGNDRAYSGHDVDGPQHLSDGFYFEWGAEPFGKQLSMNSRKGHRSERSGIFGLDSSQDTAQELVCFFIDQAKMSQIGSFQDDLVVFIQNDAVNTDRADVNSNIIIHIFQSFE